MTEAREQLRMPEITTDDVRLVLDADSVREVKHGRRQTTKLKRYNVFVGDTDIGYVELTMCTFEQRTPGRMYVNRRWQSPRWRAQRPHPARFYRVHYETRKAALHSLVADFNADQRRAHENNA